MSEATPSTLVSNQSWNNEVVDNKTNDNEKTLSKTQMTFVHSMMSYVDVFFLQGSRQDSRKSKMESFQTMVNDG